MAYKGRFTPKNPQKYKGNARNIIYRSLWERKIMTVLDLSDDVVQWSSEEVVVPYRSPIDRKMHRYYLDFWMKRADGQELILEVKPHKETLVPEKPKRMTKRFKKEVATYAVNQKKWEAARRYAKNRGMKFELITEKNFNFD
jgi:hypothetical protein